MKLIRQISIGQNYKDAMYYRTGQEVFGGHEITDIIEKDNSYEIYIKKNDEVKPWKEFNKNMGISVEYNLDY